MLRPKDLDRRDRRVERIADLVHERGIEPHHSADNPLARPRLAEELGAGIGAGESLRSVAPAGLATSVPALRLLPRLAARLDPAGASDGRRTRTRSGHVTSGRMGRVRTWTGAAA
jgi:hypothetical protein